MPWPTIHVNLEEWSAYRIFGSNLLKQGQVRPNMLVFCLLGLSFYHDNYHFSVLVFNNPCLPWIIKGGRTLFASVKSTSLPIIKDILQKITSQPTKSLEDLNINAAFKIALAGFLLLGEITYIASELKKRSIFAETHATRFDISFAEGDQYTVLRLKHSKTD